MARIILGISVFGSLDDIGLQWFGKLDEILTETAHPDDQVFVFFRVDLGILQILRGQHVNLQRLPALGKVGFGKGGEGSAALRFAELGF